MRDAVDEDDEASSGAASDRSELSASLHACTQQLHALCAQLGLDAFSASGDLDDDDDVVELRGPVPTTELSASDRLATLDGERDVKDATTQDDGSAAGIADECLQMLASLESITYEWLQHCGGRRR